MSEPLLVGIEADRAWQAILAIAADLERQDTPTSPSLSNGLAGEALFFAEVARARDDDEAAEAALRRLEQALDRLGNHASSPALFGGFAGVGWTLSHLEDRLLESEDASDQAVEQALLELLKQPLWAGPYDLVHGLVGFGVYALETLPRPGAKHLLERVVHHLGATAVEGPEGFFWHSAPQWLPPHQRRAAPQGHVDMGLAHGVPGVVALLAAIATQEIAPRRVRDLLDGTVAWLLAQARKDELSAQSAFPHFLVPGLEPEASRLAWCYGDLGIALALESAARVAHRADWREEALSLALEASGRTPAQGRVEDAGLCHGAAGVGHLLHHMYRDTGNDELGAAARRWLRTALDLRRPDRGVGGYQAWAPSRGGWIDDRSWLTGAAGVGLALLSAVTPWER